MAHKRLQQSTCLELSNQRQPCLKIFRLPQVWWTATAALKSYLTSRLFNSSDFYSYPGVFPWFFPSVPPDCKCSRARIGSLAHFNYHTGWCTPYFKDGTTTIQPCASNAAPGLDLSPRYADVYSHVSCKISYRTFSEKWFLQDAFCCVITNLEKASSVKIIEQFYIMVLLSFMS